MATFENQRTIITHTKMKENETNFIQVRKEDLKQLAHLKLNNNNRLTYLQILIYIDLCGNADGYHKEFSPAYYQNQYNISKSSAQDAFKALESAGLITKDETKTDTYHFYRNIDESIVKNTIQ